MATKPPLPEIPDDQNSTRRITPDNATRRMNPVQPAQPTQRMPNQTRLVDPAPNIPLPPTHSPPAQSPPPRRPSDSGLSPNRKKRGAGGPLPPLWSCGVMLFIVAALVVGIVALILALGGRTAPASTPRILVTPYNPSLVIAQGTSPAVLATATIPPEFDAGVSVPAGQMALIGPTLPPPQITPTPANVAIGSTVRAVQGVNVRLDAGINNSVRFVADAGELFRVLDGPRQVDGLIWWQIQALDDASRVGWAAENDGTTDLLEVVQEQPQ